MNTQKLFEKKDVENLAKNVLEKLTDKIKSDIADKFYSEMSGYLYDHYDNANDKIKNNLIDQISEEFIRDPKDYRYKKLRDKIFAENNKTFIDVITEEKITESVERIILNYYHKDYHFSWQWRDGISEIILKNIDYFTANERFKNTYSREIENLQNEIKRLKEILDDEGIEEG